MPPQQYAINRQTTENLSTMPSTMIISTEEFVQVDKELQNEGNKGWMPFERHKWPLLEPDNDMCIQEEQAHAATTAVWRWKTSRLVWPVDQDRTAMTAEAIYPYLGDDDCVINPLFVYRM